MPASLGRFGETWAAGHLTRLGYQILERNVRYRSGELDIVAEEAGELVFVEVKCRRSRRFGTPESSIDRRRYARMAAAIEEYLSSRGIEPDSYRIDVVALEVDAEGRVAQARLLRGVEPPASSR
jgi:putative endonuclease